MHYKPQKRHNIPQNRVLPSEKGQKLRNFGHFALISVKNVKILKPIFLEIQLKMMVIMGFRDGF